MKCLLGRKLAMSQVLGSDGSMIPVTLVQAGPCVVSQLRTKEQDGYWAVQLGFGKKRSLSQPEAGHLKDLPLMAHLCEFRFPPDVSVIPWKRGDVLDGSLFQLGDVVQVSGISKGKGFQGVVKRHHFHGHPTSHGHKDQARLPGSIGAGGVQHVLKGRRMAGHMGAKRVTVKNLQIVEVREGGVLAIRGAIPGARNSLVQIVSES